MLGDAAGLSRGDVDVSDLVEQARLAVVDVAQDGDDRRAGAEVFGHGFTRLKFLHQLLFHRRLQFETR